MGLTLVKPSSYIYCKLSEQYPTNKTFYMEYTSGTYLDRAYTTYYDAEKKELMIESHSNYD